MTPDYCKNEGCLTAASIPTTGGYCLDHWSHYGFAPNHIGILPHSSADDAAKVHAGKAQRTEVSAAQILTTAAGHLQERAATYDQPQGERSIGKTVNMFHALTGIKMTEEQGWLFMACLKMVRAQQGKYRADSYEDGSAYFALAGESAAKERT